MKINIGPYKSDIIPVYRWGKNYEYWRKPDTCYLPEEEYTWYDKFVYGFFDILSILVNPLNKWSNRRERKIKVHIDNYDVWSADHTLAVIIAPVLKRLKEEQYGHPFVDNEDVPEHMRMSKKDIKKYENDMSTDDNWVVRWEYVLDEMIWTFEQHADEDGGTGDFHHNPEQIQLVTTNSTLTFNHQKDPSKPSYFRDDEGLNKHAERKSNGRRLFAKYYESLWD